MKRCLLVLLALAACKKGGTTAPPEEPDAVAVTCEPARASTATDHVTLNGTVNAPPDRLAQVTPAIAGKITLVRVHEGDTVVKGQELALVEDPTLAANAGEAAAATATAKANLDNAVAAAARAQRLFDEGISARREVEDANARKAGAQAELAAARAKSGLAAGQSARAHVRAPIAGTVLHLTKRVGEMVDGTAATPIAEIADTSVLGLDVDAPAADLIRLGLGAHAEVHLDALAGVTLPGHVASVAPAVDPASSLGKVRILIDKVPPGVQLKIGLAGQAAVEVAQRQGVVRVPARALRRSTEGKEQVVVCQAAAGATKAEPREVKTASRLGDDVEILEGLQPGERVVTDHPLGLDDGAKLEPAGEPAAGGGASDAGQEPRK